MSMFFAAALWLWPALFTNAQPNSGPFPVPFGSAALLSSNQVVKDWQHFGPVSQSNPGSFGLDGGTTIVTNFMSRAGYRLTDDCRDLVCVFDFKNGFSTPNPTNTLHIHAAWERPDGTIQPMTFNGQWDITLSAFGVAVSDPLPEFFNTNTIIYIRTFGWTANGNKWPIGYFAGSSSPVINHGSYTSGSNNIVDQTLNGSIADAVAYGYAPLAIFGTVSNSTPTLPRALVYGDSLSCQADVIQYQHSYIERAFAMRGQSYVNLAINGGAIEDALTNVGNVLLNYVDQIYVELGNNNYHGDRGSNNTNTIVQLYTSLFNQISARKKGLVIQTIAPYTTSSDAWTTTNGQTVLSTETNRVFLNMWLRSYVTNHPTAVLVDLADACETSRDSGLWKVLNGNAITTDGRHPRPPYGQLVSTNILPQMPNTWTPFVP